MNMDYKNLENAVGATSNTISDVLSKLKEKDEKDGKKEGVSLLDITKKLSSKKFENKKKEK